MVDVTKAMESKYVNADLIRDSPTKKCIIMNEGEYVEGEYGEKLQIEIMIDKKTKVYSPNKDTLSNISSELGKDTSTWIGAILKLKVVKVRGKDCVVGELFQAPVKVTSEVI